MNKRTISILLALTSAFLVGLPGALSLPQYLDAFQKVYTDGSCGTCHVDPAGGGDRNTYGTMFENQPNHATDPAAALQAIGPAPGTSPLATATVTATQTPNVTETPAITETLNVTEIPTVITTPTAISTPNATFTANMTGSEEVPPVDTLAQGNATFNLSNDGTTLQFEVTVANITNATVSHIHLAPVGVNGSIVVVLYPGPPKIGRFDGVLAEGNITQADLTGPLAGQPLSALIDNMTAGNTYVNVHTIQNPDGEIRGQIQMMSAPIAPNATFNISGFKINDTNGNGVWDSGEMGIPNWNFSLLNATGALIDNQSTDATGLYQFMDVAPGVYNVTEEMQPGFNSTNATSMLVTVENTDVMNVNFTNQPVAPTTTPNVTETVTATATPTLTPTATPNVTETPAITPTVTPTITPTITATPTAQNLLIQNAQQQIQNAQQLIQIASQLIQIAVQQIQSAQQQIQIAQQIQNASSGT